MSTRAPEQRRSNRTLWALLLSLVAHGLLLFAVASSTTSSRPPPKTPEPLQLELVYVPLEGKKVEAPTQTPKLPPAKKQLAKKPRVVTEEAPSTTAVVEAPPSDEPASVPEEEPKQKLSLVPEWSLPLTPSNKGSPWSRSQTITNDGFGPTEEEKRRYEAEVLQRNMNKELAAQASRARIQSGNVPSELGALERNFVDAVGGDHAFLTPQQKANPTKQGVLDGLTAWQSTAEQYAKTGSPLSNPKETEAIEESGFGQSFLGNPNSPQFGDLDDQARMYGALQSMAAIGAINKRRNPTLRTLIELEQTSTGAVSNARLLQTSGNKDFDTFALKTTLDVATRFKFDAGSFPAWRSVWKFEFEKPKVSVDLIEALPIE